MSKNLLSVAPNCVKLSLNEPCELHLDQTLILWKGTINLQTAERGLGNAEINYLKLR